MSLSALCSCTPYKEPLPPRGRLHFPIGLTLHPEGRFLYVVNSNFDTTYSPDFGGTVSVVDTETLTIAAAQSPYIPSFGGDIVLNADATKAYVNARKGDAVVAFDVANGDDVLNGSALFCVDQDGAKSSSPEACLLSRVPDIKGGVRMPSDPSGLDVVTVQREIEGAMVPIDVVAISHLDSNNVSAMTLPRGQRSAATLVHAPLIDSANAVKNRPGTLNMYVAGRNSNSVAIFAPFLNSKGQAEAIVRRGFVELNNLTSAVDARGLAFSTSGDTLYVATRRPDAVYVFNIVEGDVETGQGTAHELMRVISVADQPSSLVSFEAPGRDPVLYVPCFDNQSIQVVDPRTGTMLDEIELDSRPYDMVIDSVKTSCQAPGERCRAYVTLFADTAQVGERCENTVTGCGSVAVIDLDPASPRYHQVIAKIR